MKLQFKENNKNEITSLELVEQINIFRKQEGKKVELLHKTLLEIIRDEFEEEISQQKILPSNYKTSRGRTYPMFNLTLSQAKQVLVRESKFVRRAIIQYIEKLEDELKGKKISENKTEIKKLPFKYKLVKRKTALIPIYQTDIGEHFIKAKELWKELELKHYYKKWISQRIEKYDLLEDFDYVDMGDDYALTLDTAKELSAIENNTMGKVIRKYIISFEKTLKDKRTKEIEALEERIKNRKLGYILTNTRAIKHHTTEILELANSLKAGKPLTLGEKNKLSSYCILLRAYAFPTELDKKYGLEEKGLIQFEYFPKEA